MKTVLWNFAALLSVLALMAGCADDSAPAPVVITTDNCAGEALAANWGCIQDFVFTPACTRCHSGAFASQGLSLDAANSPGIVGRASTEQPLLNLIEPGDPDNSYLIRKIEGDPSISLSRMPFGGPFLDDPAIQIMRDWVTAGAVTP